MRVLVVDDEADIRMILRLNLERWGHEVRVAANGAEAYEAITVDPPQALLLDVSMPGESGLELLARLRSEGLAPPRIALLSAMLPEHWLSTPGADAVLHLSKPFGIADLEAMMQALAAPT